MLTERQRDVLEAIRTYREVNECGPTHSALAEILDLKRGSIPPTLNRLRLLGVITWNTAPGSLRVIGPTTVAKKRRGRA